MREAVLDKILMVIDESLGSPHLTEEDKDYLRCDMIGIRDLRNRLPQEDELH